MNHFVGLVYSGKVDGKVCKTLMQLDDSVSVHACDGIYFIEKDGIQTELLERPLIFPHECTDAMRCWLVEPYEAD